VLTRVVQRKRPRKSVLLALAGAAVAAGLFAAVAFATTAFDTGTATGNPPTFTGNCDITIPDNTTSKDCQLGPAGAFVSYIGSNDTARQASGTGLFDPFARLQGSPTEQGYNTCSQSSCGGDVSQFDTKTGTWTHAIKVNAIPVVNCDGTTGGSSQPQCWQLFNDINDSNTAKRISLNDVQLFFTTNARITGYSAGNPPGTPPSFSTPATLEYSFHGNILINDVNSGSGRGDLRYLIPTAGHTWTADTYFVLYSKWGTTNSSVTANAGTGGWSSDGGFEEWKVRKAPNVSITKTANPVGPVTAGSNIGFDITVSNTGAGDATGVTITDPLPAGPAGGDLNWSLSPAFSGCSIAGNVGSQTLTCTFATLAAGASIGPIHITSPTTGHDCAVVNNTGTVTSTNDGGGSSSDSVTVQCPDVKVVKTPDSEATAPGTVTAGDNAVFTIVVTNLGPGTATAVTLTDVLPGPASASWAIGGADYTAAACGASPKAGLSTLTCNFGSVAAGGTKTITLTYATVAADCARASGTGDIDNTANVTATNEDASKLANNSDHGDVVVQCPDVKVVKTPDSEATAPGTVKAGDNAVFTIVVTNLGPGTATAVTLTDVLPGGTSLSWTVGGADAGDCVGSNPHAGGSTLTCNFGAVAALGTKTITLTSPTTSADCARIGPPAGDIFNTASVSATNEDTTKLANNSDDGDVHVQCAAIKILKESTKTGNPLVKVAGAVFHVTGPASFATDVTDNGTGDEDATIGSVCISGLAPGDYTVTETTPPPGYGTGTAVNGTATAADGTGCDTVAAADTAVFTDPPLSDIQVNFRDGGSGETSATISCDNTDGTKDTTAATGWDTTDTESGVAPQTITCTIVIDP
jgi:uncharacterized repeat protein (TIGR01451 family)